MQLPAIITKTGQQVGKLFNFNPQVPTNDNPFERIGRDATLYFLGQIQERERNFKLKGRQKYVTYAKIYNECTEISASVDWALSLVGNANWSVLPADGDTNDDIAKQFEKMIFDDPITSWDEINKRAAMSKFYGFSLQEIVLKQDGGTITIDDIYPVPQQTIDRWIEVDGKVEGVMQYLDYRSFGDKKVIPIPRDRLVYAVERGLSDSAEGYGLFRAAVSDAIRLIEIEDLEMVAYLTDVGGMPFAKIPFAELNRQFPTNTSDADTNNRNRAEIDKRILPYSRAIKDYLKGKVGQGLLGESKTYQVTDQNTGKTTISNIPEFDFQVVKGEARGLNELYQLKTSYKKDIARVFGTESILLGEGSTGSFALAKEKDSRFAQIVQGILEKNQRVFQRDIVDKLAVENNIPEDRIPRLYVETANNVSLEDKVRVVEELGKNGLLAADDPLVDEIRTEAGFSATPAEIVQRLITEPLPLPTPTGEV